MLRREATHDELAPWAHLDEAFLEEEPEGVPDRRARVSERLGDLGLGKDAACGELAAQDAVADVVVGLFGQLAPSERLAHLAHLGHVATGVP